MSHDPAELAALVEAALIECPELIERGTAMARSLARELPAVESADLALAVRATLVRDALDDPIMNPFLYAKETALRMSRRALENRLESQEGNERRQPKDQPRTEGWRMVTTAPAKRGNDPEADEFMALMETSLSRQPELWVGDGPHNRQLAKDRILDSVSLLYRSKGQGAGQFFRDGDKTYAICFRKPHVELARQAMWAWLGIVREATEAKRAGRAIVPEIPNAYQFVLQRLMAEIKRVGGEEVEPVVAAPFAV